MRPRRPHALDPCLDYEVASEEEWEEEPEGTDLQARLSCHIAIVGCSECLGVTFNTIRILELRRRQW